MVGDNGRIDDELAGASDELIGATEEYNEVYEQHEDFIGTYGALTLDR